MGRTDGGTGTRMLEDGGWTGDRISKEMEIIGMGSCRVSPRGVQVLVPDQVGIRPKKFKNKTPNSNKQKIWTGKRQK